MFFRLAIVITALAISWPTALHLPPRPSPTQRVLPAIPEEDPGVPPVKTTTGDVRPGFDPAPVNAPTGSPLQATNPDFLLPDLRTLPPADIEIERSGDRKLLRLANAVLNGGPGALEVKGVPDPASERTTVTQHIFTADGTFLARPIGSFVFHPTHRHWHLENFARYELWTLTPEGIRGHLIALTDKVSFCLRDLTRARFLENIPRAAYTSCGREIQGMTVGWVDTYGSHLPGQIVDITHVPDGVYALRSVADPGDLLLEFEEDNNSATTYIRIEGDRVHTLDRGFALTQLFNAGYR